LLTDPDDPKRGEVWFVDLEPTEGDEINKERRCLVISSDAMGTLDLRIVVPLTTWQDKFEGRAWLTRVDPTPDSGLTRPSAADTFQVRSVSVNRFAAKRSGVLPDDVVDRIVQTLAITVGYEPPKPPTLEEKDPE
jgi:mRNA interferase MazF